MMKKQAKSVQAILKFDELIKKSKKINLIKPHTKAFKQFPTKKESHKGDPKYFDK